MLSLTAVVLSSGLVVGSLRWIDPPSSAFMMQRWVDMRLADEPPQPIHHEWTAWAQIADSLKLAVIAAEDQRFPSHRGFDFIELRNAWEDFRQGDSLRGASTISQQTAKNLFLWSGRDYLRKGLEAWFTLLLETLLSKERILELYLNIAQFSADTYGVGAASWRYFDRPAIAIDTEQAATMAAVLPNPYRYRLDAPSRRILRRAQWIQRQMRQLGGTDYLARLQKTEHGKAD